MTKTDEIKTALQGSQASAVMIVESAADASSQPGYIPAIQAIAAAEQYSSPMANAKAEAAAMEFLAANSDKAMEWINARNAARTEMAAKPLSAGAQGALRGED